MKQCICIVTRDLTQFLNRRDTAKLLIYLCLTFTNWISRDGFRDQFLTWWLPNATHHGECKLTLVIYNYYYWHHCCWCYVLSSFYKWISKGYIEKEKKRVDWLNHDARNHMGGSRGGLTPWKITSYMGFYWQKAIGPPCKKLDPLENIPPPLEPWQIIVFFESNHWTTVK